MTKEEKWKASIACDASYDGKFFYGVKTTGIFCRPSCKSKSPKMENVLFSIVWRKHKGRAFVPVSDAVPIFRNFSPKRKKQEK